MERPHLLHMITPDANVSPFDVNMAYDAGFDAVIPYTHVAVKDVRGLVQDMIFSRSVNDVKRTALFICGRDASLALDMLDKARDAMVPPFEISCFPDPAGSFTTAAAMVACVEKALRDKKKRELKGCTVAVFGATGVVGGNVPLALGSALAARLLGGDRVAVVFFGDGAVQSGIFAESVNLATLWRLPVILVCENNGFAEFTPRSAHTTVERVSDVVAPYGLDRETVDGNDVLAVREAFARFLASARAGGGRRGVLAGSVDGPRGGGPVPRRPPGGRVQLPLRRSRDPADSHAAGERPA